MCVFEKKWIGNAKSVKFLKCENGPGMGEKILQSEKFIYLDISVQ
jgi:hypothetical protein